MDTNIQRIDVDACFLAPSRYAHGLPAKGQHSVSPCVTSLLFCCGPAAVSWFVVTIVIDAIKAMTRRSAWSHVLIKCLEGVSPSLAHPYATSAIVSVSRMSGKIAPLAHVAPCNVFWQAVYDRIAYIHDDTLNIRLVRTARQRQLLSRSHFTMMCSSGAISTCSSFRKECFS